MAKSRVVSAVGTAIGRAAPPKPGDPAPRPGSSQAKVAAVVAAVEKALADGITDPDQIRALKRAAIEGL